MEQVTLKTRSTDWKDKAAGWHQWRGVSTCPTCGKKFKDTLSGTRAAAEAWDGECPKCDEAEDLATIQTTDAGHHAHPVAPSTTKAEPLPANYYNEEERVEDWNDGEPTHYLG